MLEYPIAENATNNDSYELTDGKYYITLFPRQTLQNTNHVRRYVR